MKAIIFCFCGLLLISGCHRWPMEGRGGVAELAPFEVPYHPMRRDYPESYQKIIYLRLKNTHNTLHKLAQQGAKRCFPGLYQQSILRFNRIAREIADYLYSDANQELVELNKSIHHLRLHLNRLKNRQICR